MSGKQGESCMTVEYDKGLFKGEYVGDLLGDECLT